MGAARVTQARASARGTLSCSLALELG
jgi:hypothetical protein